MPEGYEPKSDLLKAVVADLEPLGGSDNGDENLRQVIALTKDADVSNRDWATLLLAQHDGNCALVIEVLLTVAAEDLDDVVRAEAILGIAERDRDLARPLLRRALSGAAVCVPILQAAAIVADPCLLTDLREFAGGSGSGWVDGLVADALRACEAARGPGLTE